jgi:hypothetical protein
MMQQGAPCNQPRWCGSVAMQLLGVFMTAPCASGSGMPCNGWATLDPC